MAINLGAQFSDADFVAVVDGRTVSVDEHWIERFLLLFEEGPRRLLACPRTVEFDDTGEKKAFFDLTWNWDAPGLALTRFEPPREGPFAAVSCPDTVIFFKRRRFLDLGGLDPHLPDLTDGWRDLSIRAWLSGDEVVCHPGILVERKRAAGVAATSLGAWLTTRKCFTDERRLAACEKAVATTLRPRGLFRHIEDERKLFLERARFDDDWLFYKFGIGGPPDGS